MTSRKINLLDHRTINQIAAGEVVENTATVIKELVENALDAKASHILIETSSHFLRIIDDGHGIFEEDLPLAIERHATSKLQNIDDLLHLSSLGFRGEALASIASVSKISLHSAVDSLGLGIYFEALGGKEIKRIKKPRRQGTTIEVSDLFFNVPVRKKNLHSGRKESAEIHKILMLQTLCNLGIGFSWLHEGKCQFEIDQDAPLIERIKSLLGKEYADPLLEIEYETEGFHLKGYVSRPFFNRPNRSGQFLFINNRAVVCPFVSEKIEQGYATRINERRFPIFILFLSVPKEEIDVNVHPQKKEVRLRCESRLGSFLISSIERTLEGKKLSKTFSFQAAAFPSQPAFLPSFTYPEKNESSFSQLSFASKCRFLFRLGRFFLIEKEETFWMVDLHSARMKLCSSFFQEDLKPSLQQLLTPLTFEFSESEKQTLLENLNALNQKGISVRFFGQRTFIVDAVWKHLDRDEVGDILHMFIAGKSRSEKKIAGCFRKKKIAVEEGMNIIEKFFEYLLPNVDLEGRPIFIELSEQELEKRFYGSY